MTKLSISTHCVGTDYLFSYQFCTNFLFQLIYIIFAPLKVGK